MCRMMKSSLTLPGLMGLGPAARMPPDKPATSLLEGGAS